MRHILIDRARRLLRLRHGENAEQVGLTPMVAAAIN